MIQNNHYLQKRVEERDSATHQANRQQSDNSIFLWHVISPDDLLWEAWETEYTLFDRNSGETHLINELPAQILRILTESPKTTFDLTEELSRLCEVENNEHWRQQTLTTLGNLESLGLIETQDP